VVVITAVLIVQCLLFADGGIVALGANVFNMGVIGSAGGYVIYRGVRLLFKNDRGRYLAVVLAAWGSTVLAAACCAGELAWSGTVPWTSAFPAMTGLHMLIAIGEAVISCLVFSAIAAARPDIVAEDPRSSPPGGGRDILLYGALITIGVVLFISPFASRWPDGLESVASKLGFASRALASPLVSSPFEGYRIPGLGSPVAATVIAGLAGTCIVFAGGFLLAHVLTRRSRNEA
ncbi:MAG TPA: energy-coupling factor ABC transporter permease, partial [Bacteroidota bacterium]|nr:energy-coupling factor ABC transporter permease [Bacteroidota bacterium]